MGFKAHFFILFIKDLIVQKLNTICSRWGTKKVWWGTNILCVGTKKYTRGTTIYGRGTLATKREEIKIRLTKEQKELIKRVADKQGISMSEFILSKIEPLAKSIECNLDNKEMIEDRINNTEDKIQLIKLKMQERSGKKKR